MVGHFTMFAELNETLRSVETLTKKLHFALEPTFKWLGDLWPSKILHWEKGFYNPRLTADFCLHGEEESAGFLLWEPVWSSSLMHLRNQPTTASVDTFCSFQPVCLGTGCGSGECLIENSHHSVYRELSIKLEKISAYALISGSLQICWWQ